MLSASFFDSLKPDSLILTPNRRLCGFIESEYNQHQKVKNLTSWSAITIHPFSSWLKQVWQQNLQASPTLLTEHQVLYSWKQIIQKHSPALLKTDAAAKQAIEAMRMLVLWNVPIEELSFQQQTDCQAFYQWYQNYRAFCVSNNVIDKYHMINTMINKNQDFESSFQTTKQITLVGFDEIPPLWQLFLNRCAEKVSVQTFDFSMTPKKTIRYEFSDFKTELSHAIAWIKKEYENKPQQSLACVIPSLSENRAYIEKAFMKNFSPQKFMQLQDKDELPFNISAGQALGDFEIIKTANTLLAFNNRSLTPDQARFLLRSPFIIGYYKEFRKRAALDFKITNLNSSRLSHDFFSSLLMEHCPILAVHFYKFSKLTCKTKHSLFDWVAYFNKRLELLGWPGERELSSQNYQLVNRYKELFNEFLSLNLHVKSCTKADALALLKTLSQDTLFQVKTGEKKIQVLGTLEAAGMTFDKLWLMQCNSHIWPAPANPNPFIPHGLQKEFELPHATAERELNFAKTLFTRYQNSCSLLFMSSAREENNQEINPSFLIENTEVTDCELKPSDPIDFIQKQSKLERFTDEQSLKIKKDEYSQIRGGTGILAAQAACPFKAFATYRLNARSAPSPQPGLTALERGEIIHGALELFWKRVHSLEAYTLLTPEEQTKINRQCAEASILAIEAHLYKSQPRLFGIETTRVIKIMGDWLALESKRDDFEVIATEEIVKTNFAELPLSLRIDRIDKLGNGALVLIDYKTGMTSPNRWFGERIDEPQLPLYALIYPQAIDGILFGQVRNNEFAIKGVGSELAESFGIKNIVKVAQTEQMNWGELKKAWQNDLGMTVKSFLDGCADIKPKYASQTCNFCELKSLCRIEELTNDSD